MLSSLVVSVVKGERTDGAEGAVNIGGVRLGLEKTQS
jgi:hypothetical protein